jgi:class 3 adenylate cyclase/tetratricopeptide (TPR) repeat protein
LTKTEANLRRAGLRIGGVVHCSKCRAENPPDHRFCGQCGAALGARCPSCGAEVTGAGRFCGQCGAALEAGSAAGAGRIEADPPPRRPAVYTPKHLAEKILRTRSALEGERRLVTVLFADLAGFTGLAERLDPEDVHAIIDRCFEVITAEVHRLEGTINQYTGDGVMALFGAPIAHEDGPRRAVHAALGIQRALGDLSRELQAQRGLSIRMRIGLHTGPVVVGRIGDDLRMDYTAVGDTTNLAARLQQIARPGSVIISESTRKAVEGFFEAVDLGELAVKGHTPVRAFEILRPRGRRSRLEVAAEQGLTPLVGRDREVVTLLDLFQEVKAGHGQVVHVTGEAGIGKSRLVLELRRRLTGAGEHVTWLEGQCVTFGQSIAFLPVIEQLRHNFGIEELDGEPEIIAKVEHGMRRMGGLEVHIPYVRYLLGVDPGDPAVAAMDPLARRRKILDAVHALAWRGAQLRPVVFVYEDLHWVDASTEEHLGAFIDSLASLPVLVVLTYRLGYTPQFGSRSYSTVLTLRSLSESEALAVAGRVLGTDRFPPELRAALIEKAEGVPLFVEEVTKTLLDLGVLRRDNGGYRMVKGMAEVSIPETIQDIIMARLDRLGEDGKRMVQLASVIGRQFLKRLLERIAGLSERLEGLLAELKALEIVYEQGLLPEPAYIFKHALIQDVAYQSLLVQRRKALHRAVGEAIEELYADRLSDHYEELAHHFSMGEEWARAFDYALRSGDRARDAYANQAALDWYGRASDAAERAGTGVEPARFLEVLQRRARVWIILSRYPEAITELEGMREAAVRTGNRRGEGQALAELAFAHFATLSADHLPALQASAEAALAIGRETGDRHVVAKSLISLGTVDQCVGDLDAADRKLEESLRLSEAAGLKDSAARALLWMGAHANWRGDFRRAVLLGERAERTAAEVHDHYSESLAMAFRCLAHVGLGEYAQAFVVIRDGLDKARERSINFNIGRLTNSLGWLHQELGDFRRAVEHDQEGVDLGVRYRIPNVEISALLNLGIDHVHLGAPDKALALLETVTGRLEAAFGAHRWRWIMRLGTPVGEALIAMGRPEQALPHLETAMATARATGSRKYIAKILALRGEIAASGGDWARAEAELAEALRIAREIAYPTLTWQAAHALGRALVAQERGEEALAAMRLGVETIENVQARIPDATLLEAFQAWPRVQAAHDDLDRLLRRG